MKQPPLPWYEKKGLLILLLVFLWPVGVFGMWRSTAFQQRTKFVVSALFVLLTIAIVNAPPPPDEKSAAQAGPSQSITAELSTAELEDAIKDSLSGGFFESGISGDDLVSLELDNGLDSFGLRIRVNTGEWTGLFKQTELAMKMADLLTPLHRVCADFPKLDRVRIKLFCPAAARRDEYGNEQDESDMMWAQFDINCDDFRTFEADKITNGGVYIADRYKTFIHGQIQRDYGWPEVSLEQKRLWF